MYIDFDIVVYFVVDNVWLVVVVFCYLFIMWINCKVVGLDVFCFYVGVFDFVDYFVKFFVVLS